jgi:tetraacyldisaccharide 4'-kinase
MTLKGDRAINLADPTLSRPLADFRNQPTLALAGIGHPARFFAHLEQHGLKPERRVFPDHHAYRPDDLLRPADTHLLMTEKDAVKCAQWADSHGWYVPVEAMLPPGIADLLHQLLLGT